MSQCVYIKTLEFPTDIIEEGWVSARVYEHAGKVYASLVWPREKEIGEEMAIRLEKLTISLYEQEKRANAKV